MLCTIYRGYLKLLKELIGHQTGKFKQFRLIVSLIVMQVHASNAIGISDSRLNEIESKVSNKGNSFYQIDRLIDEQRSLNTSQENTAFKK